MIKQIGTFFIGLVFGLGLIVSQMTNPDKVLNFLTFGDDWDPSLSLVMAAAMAVMMLAWWRVSKRNKPLFSSGFDLSEFKQIDIKLITGAALFGLGWGISGICPGPGVVQLASGNLDFILFFVAVLVGMYLPKIAARNNG